MREIGSNGPKYAVPPVARAFKLLRHVATGDTITNMSDTARKLGISRTTLLRLIGTLEAEQIIEQIGDRPGYRLGLGLASLAGQAIFATDIVQAGQSVIAELTDQLSLSSHIGVLSGRDILYLARRTPNVHLVSNVGIGSRLPAHATTIGRIILGHMPRADVTKLFEGMKLKAATVKTATSVAALLRQVEQDRALGIAWSDSNFEPGISSAAAVVFDRTGGVAGAINVTGPSGNFSSESRPAIGNALSAAAQQISQRLGYVAARVEPIATTKKRRSR